MITRLRWTSELVERFWCAVGQTRLRELSFSRHSAGDILDLASPYLRAGARHLDFGGGDGDLVQALLKRGHHAAYFEPNPQRTANLGSEITNHPDFLGVVREDRTSELPFDVVFLLEVVEHILDDDIEEVFAHIRRLLKPDGLVVLTTPLAEDLELGYCYCPSCGAYFHRWQHQRSFTGESLRTWLHDQGFAVVTMREVDLSSNRVMLAELRRLYEELVAYWTRQEWSLVARARRKILGQEAGPPPRGRCNVEESPTTLFCVASPEG